MHIPMACPDLTGNEAKYLLDALNNEGRISSSGKYLEKFEKLLAERFARTFALSTSNGTTALHLALLGLGIGPGDEVIVPTLTFSASVATIVHCGATPIFIDAKKDDWTLDIEQLQKKITPRTKAVVAVDLYGMPCDYAPLQDWRILKNIFLIEDAAEAHGATYASRPVGSFGDVSCFSFYGNKIITTGEGGACLTNDGELAKRMSVFKNHGMTRPGIYEHEVAGYNYRLTNIQAAIGVAQLERFDYFLEKRREHEALYRTLLKDEPRIRFQEYPPSKKPVSWLVSILVDGDLDKICQHMREHGVDTRRLFKPMHLQKPYLSYAQGQSFPVAEHLHRQGLCLPSSSLLLEDEIHYVCKQLKEALRI